MRSVDNKSTLSFDFGRNLSELTSIKVFELKARSFFERCLIENSKRDPFHFSSILFLSLAHSQESIYLSIPYTYPPTFSLVTPYLSLFFSFSSSTLPSLTFFLLLLFPATIRLSYPNPLSFLPSQTFLLQYSSPSLIYFRIFYLPVPSLFFHYHALHTYFFFDFHTLPRLCLCPSLPLHTLSLRPILSHLFFSFLSLSSSLYSPPVTFLSFVVLGRNGVL